MSQFAVVIPAAGQSRRFGGPDKKPFVGLDGRPIWQRSAELFWTRPDVSKVYLVIDPDECIDCAVCIPECPVNAILPEEDVPGDQQHFIKLNADLSRNWPSITRSKAPLPDADDWKDKSGKLSELTR